MSTSSVASVPPVEAPRPIITWSREGFAPSRGALGTATGTAGARRTFAPAAAMTFWVNAVIKTSFWPGSGLRTKSTAPADRASNTRRFREDTRITGRGYLGSSFLRNSIPFMPGISMSEVMTSGLTCATLDKASTALNAVPTISIRGLLASPCVIIVRARTESSTTRTRIVLFMDHIEAVSPLLFCFRTCLLSQRVGTGEGIFCPARQKAAAILTDCKGF